MIWVTHMKTTVEISDPLLRRAKRLAAKRGTTLKAVIEDALRTELAAAEAVASGTSVRTHTFGGRGLKAGLAWDDWATIRSLAYEGRGG
jgi:predicted transcriptional regulator